MPILPSTPLWWCKVNQFPKGFPNLLLYYTGYNKPLTYNWSASLSDSFGLKRFSGGGIAIHLLHCFLSWRQEFQKHFKTRMECLWQQKFHNFPFRYNCYDVPNILWWKQNFFLPMCVLQMKCIDMVSFDYLKLIIWQSSYMSSARSEDPS